MVDLQRLKNNKASQEEILKVLKDNLNLEQLYKLCTEYGISFRSNTSNKKKYEKTAQFLVTLFMYQRIACE